MSLFFPDKNLLLSFRAIDGVVNSTGNKLNLLNDENRGGNLTDFVDIRKYKYAFHTSYDPITTHREFLYQIYTSKNFDNSFRSGFGFFSLKNKQNYDKNGHITFCLNCDPKKSYSEKTINFNSLGNVVNVVTSSANKNLTNIGWVRESVISGPFSPCLTSTT